LGIDRFDEAMRGLQFRQIVSRQRPRMRRRYAAVALPALVGTALAGLAYFTRNTGVDGTLGALLALLGAAAVMLGSLLAVFRAARGGFLTALDILLGTGALLTATAAFFLMQYGFAIAMTAALLGLVIAATTSPRRPA
jgi:quinoprotein glucose dehydrogenase